MTASRGAVLVGDVLPSQTFEITRADLIRYAGASGDFNPIHWSPETAVSVGLPGVIAHGMLTMATACRIVSDWTGDPAAIVSYAVRFTRPVVVGPDAATELVVSGVVAAVEENGALAVVDLKATVADKTVLGKARISVRLAGTG